MGGNTSAKSYRINITNPVYALLTADAKDAVTYGEVKPLGEAMQVQLTPSVATGKLHGNGVVKEDISKLKGIAMAFDATKIPIEDRAIIQGHQYKNGVMVEKDGDEAPYLAFGYMVEGTNGKAEYVWMLKGRSAPMNETHKQSEDNITFSTDTVNINFIPREKDKEIRYFADSANADFTAAQAEAWFKTGPVSYPTATA